MIYSMWVDQERVACFFVAPCMSPLNIIPILFYRILFYDRLLACSVPANFHHVIPPH